MTLQEIVYISQNRLSDAGADSPRLDAEIIAVHSLKIERYGIITEADRVLFPEEIASIEAMVLRRINREPLAYITGKREFYGLEFIVNSDVLIPRPDTELLVECAVTCTEKNSLVLDICTGSGAVAIAMKKERDDLEVTGADISEKAVDVAKRNSLKLVDGKVDFLVSDLFSAFEGRTFDCITANPPYIDSSMKGLLQKEIDSEPDIALYSADKGHAVIDRILSDFPRFLNRGGSLFMEIGYDQGLSISERCRKAGYGCRILKDLSGNDRVASINPWNAF